jgi:hypothetical protein
MLLLTNHNSNKLSISPAFIERTGLTDKELSALTGGLKTVIETELTISIEPGTRVIALGTKEDSLAKLEANPDLFVYNEELSKSSRTLLLTIYREQSISITQHRFGALQSELLNIL